MKKRKNRKQNMYNSIQHPLLLLLAVFVLALPKTFAKNCSHVLPHNGLKFGTSQDAKL